MNVHGGTGQSLVVSEVFGPTWQGEGPSLGTLAGFVRLGRCNLACTWCDTPYTWDWERFDPAAELRHRDVAAIALEVEAMGVPLVVVSGGEPLLQQTHLLPLLRRLANGGHRLEIETAGTIEPTGEVLAVVDRFNVSPKLANSGNDRARRIRPRVLRSLASSGKAVFKFVAQREADLEEVEALASECGIERHLVWVMPEGTDAATISRRARELADPVLARGWNLTTRLHVLVWGDERGR